MSWTFFPIMNIYMKFELKNYVVITILLIGFTGIVTATASELASATTATSPAPTMITQPTQSGEVQSLYDNHGLQIGENVKNLVILIPHEGHHGPGEDNEARFIDQSFVPEIAIVSP